MFTQSTKPTNKKQIIDQNIDIETVNLSTPERSHKPDLHSLKQFMMT